MNESPTIRTQSQAISPQPRALEVHPPLFTSALCTVCSPNRIFIIYLFICKFNSFGLASINFAHVDFASQWNHLEGVPTRLVRSTNLAHTHRNAHLMLVRYREKYLWKAYGFVNKSMEIIGGFVEFSFRSYYCVNMSWYQKHWLLSRNGWWEVSFIHYVSPSVNFWIKSAVLLCKRIQQNCNELIKRKICHLFVPLNAQGHIRPCHKISIACINLVWSGHIFQIYSNISKCHMKCLSKPDRKKLFRLRECPVIATTFQHKWTSSHLQANVYTFGDWVLDVGLPWNILWTDTNLFIKVFSILTITVERWWILCSLKSRCQNLCHVQNKVGSSRLPLWHIIPFSNQIEISGIGHTHTHTKTTKKER